MRGHEHDVLTSQRELMERLRRVMAGSVDDAPRRRAEYSTDASNYRVVPRAVIAPRDAEDVLAALAGAAEMGVPVTARGAGTSCAGNAVGPGLVLDFSIHMNRIHAIDPEARTARVDPGVILGTLQQAAAPHGLRFGPDPSTTNRATLGGMIGNNACGPHAVAWGRTADNVLSLDVADGQGRRYEAGAGQGALDAVPGLEALVHAHLATIRTEFGRFNRQVSGYSLEHLLPESGQNLARFLVGSEGTLATVLGATVQLVDVPARPVLVVLGYPSMAHAADAVPALLAHNPLAVEGLDARLVDVVRRAQGAAAVPALPEGQGWLMVEVGADPTITDLQEAQADVLARARALAEAGETRHAAVVPAGPEAAALWRIRADGAGLGGRTPAGNPAWPGWEDAAVPPQHLGSYLRQFEKLMADHGVDGLMYGHFGDGCIHVRIDGPLDHLDGVPSWKRFLTEAADLVAGYGGSLSGEHGDGRTRSELLSRMYSPQALGIFGQVKTLFDPAGRLNPGILVDPDPLDENLRRPYARSAPAVRGGYALPHDGDDLTTAVHRCTGVAKCRADNSAAGGFMCPSYLATKDEKDSTRGRARVLQEAARGTLVAGWAAPEVRESLDLCLSCKACSKDCPTGMDVARYKSEVLHRTYSEPGGPRLRPMTHYVLGRLPQWTRLMHRIPGGPAVANFATGVRALAALGMAIAGIDPRRDIPRFPRERFSAWAKREARRAEAGATVQRSAEAGATAQRPADGPAARVVLWADSFSQDLDPAGARAAYTVLEQAGYEVIVPPSDACCGLTWISTGQLDGARRRLSGLLDVLAPFAANDVPIVGVEPSCTAVLRDDLPDLLPTDPRAAMVASATYTLAELLTAPAPIGPADRWQAPDLTGVRIIAQPHCHQHAVMGWRTDERLLTAAGATIEPLAGCCGLAGNFGMEKGHYEVSIAVAENSLAPALRAMPRDALFLADGFSCRTQAEHVVGTRGIHLAQLLRDGRTAAPEKP